MDKEFEAVLAAIVRRERDYWKSQCCIHCGRAEGALNPQMVTRDLRHKICIAEREFDTTLINIPEWLLALDRKETAQPGQLSLFEESEAQE